MRISDWSSDVCSSDLPTRLLPRRRLHGLTLAHRFVTRMHDDRLRLYLFLVEIDLEIQFGKGLAALADRFAIGEQAQHAQVEPAVSVFTLAIGAVSFEAGLTASDSHPVIDPGFTGRQVLQPVSGRTLHPGINIDR